MVKNSLSLEPQFPIVIKKSLNLNITNGTLFLKMQSVFQKELIKIFLNCFFFDLALNIAGKTKSKLKSNTTGTNGYLS